MELLQLKYFKDAFVTKNFSHTAEKYSVPQSAVSQSIKRLEEELGVQLFVRAANKITPNECGRYFYNYISAALIQIEKGINVVKRCDSDMNFVAKLLSDLRVIAFIPLSLGFLISKLEQLF